MNRVPLMATIALTLSLSPTALAARGDNAAHARGPVHKVLSFVHQDDERCPRTDRMFAQASAGAFLEMTAAAP